MFKFNQRDVCSHAASKMIPALYFTLLAQCIPIPILIHNDNIHPFMLTVFPTEEDKSRGSFHATLHPAP